MRRSLLVPALVVVLATVISASAEAQLGPPAHNSTATATVTSASSSHGRGIGLGAVTMLNGTSGALITYGSAGGGFHIDGIAGLHRYGGGDASTTAFTIGGRFWYHVHASSFADFSVGGGLGFISWTANPGGPGEDSRVDVSLEVGAQLRAFIVSNVALTADLGLGATFGSDVDMLIGGQSFQGTGAPEGSPNFTVGTLGIAYFFE